VRDVVMTLLRRQVQRRLALLVLDAQIRTIILEQDLRDFNVTIKRSQV
jgi:hypothetical protein